MSTKPAGPLAGKPPYATDEPDSAYKNSPSASNRRLRQPTPQENRPNSTYDVYGNYVDDKKVRQSGYGDLGADLLNGDMDDDSDDETIAYHGDLKKANGDSSATPTSQANQFPDITIVAPKPGYAAPISAIALPEPAASPEGQRSPQMSQFPSPLVIGNHEPSYMGIPSPSTPRTPHPLQPPMTPITPAFARPPKIGVKFESTQIMRGQGEETPLARRGQRGDDFWRRFSMVVKEDSERKSGSSWLEKTQSGSATMSRMVWLVALLLLVIIGGAIGFGLYISHNSKTQTTPTALGGSEDQGASLQITDSSSVARGSTSQHVTPTLTVQKRWEVEPSGVLHVFDYLPTPSPTVPIKHRKKLATRLR